MLNRFAITNLATAILISPVNAQIRGTGVTPGVMGTGATPGASGVGGSGFGVLEPLVPRHTALSVVPPAFIGYIHLADLRSYCRIRTTILITAMTPKEQRSPR